MNEMKHRPPPVDENVYEMPETAEDLKRTLQEGSLGLIARVIWFILTPVIMYGIYSMFRKNMLINPGSTEYSFVLTAIIFAPLVGIFFNAIFPRNDKTFIRVNTFVYTLIPFILAGALLFGYDKARTNQGKLIYVDQHGNELFIAPNGQPQSLETLAGGLGYSYTVDENGKAFIRESDDNSYPLRLRTEKNFWYKRSSSDMQFEELRPWVNITDRPAGDVYEAEYTIAVFQYHLGVDGISFPLILLTTLLSLIAVLASFNVGVRVKEYMSWFLVLEMGMLGTFTALDYILFYVFWELILVPMYFLIGIWGGPRKEYAALKFFLYTLFGSVFLLVGIISLYFLTGQQTFDIIKLQDLAQNSLGTSANFKWQMILFWAFFLSFAIKVPIFPFHTWLPDAHVEAPTAISVILAGVLLKMGTYGFLRMSFPTFPEATYVLAPVLGVLAIINIVYGAMVAMAQTDMKKLVAYSSIGHMGFALLGMAAMNKYGMNAAQLQIINHGIISGSLFLLVGVIYDRAHTRDLNVFGGLLPQMRVYGIVFIIASMANLGLPGLAGFWGEFWSLLGAIQNTEFTTRSGLIFFRALAPIAVIGIIITAAYMLIMVKKVFMGELNKKWAWLPDMDMRETIALLPLVFLMIFIGLYPNPLISLFDISMNDLVETVRFGAGIPPIGFK